ncbi:MULTISPECIES: hypothetical protein [unclassified Curtobacterium]|uniref:hypothetical protein n=1 Tax=unclassified Curtobacterium TaxID=257496 RepID=UPI001045C105|nr:MULTISPECIES: hypothetical protein [unclassified Curtobacterium]
MFWVLAVLGLPIMAGAWLWLSLASLEEATEQPKAVAAGTTMAGTTLLMGGIPLVLTHVLGLVVLGAVAVSGRYRRWTGMIAALVAVAVASATGITFVLILNGGQLLTSVSGSYGP